MGRCQVRQSLDHLPEFLLLMASHTTFWFLLLIFYLFYFCLIYGTSQARDFRSFMLMSHFISRQVSSRALSATCSLAARTPYSPKREVHWVGSLFRVDGSNDQSWEKGSRLVLSTETVTSSCIRLCQSTDYLSAAHPAPSRQLFTRPAPRDAHR
jgi:hypothetical protein